MRQATLTFGQSRSNTNGHAAHTPQVLPHAPKFKGANGNAVVQESAVAKKGVAEGQLHPMFVKQVYSKKKEDQSKEAGLIAPVAVQQRPVRVPALFRKRLQPDPAPWPGKGESHVHSDGEVIIAPAGSSVIPFERLPPREKKRHTAPKWTVGEEIWPWGLIDTEKCHLERSGVETCRSLRPSSQQPHLWTETSRPHRSADVLGNGPQATYLRDWLKVLQVTGGAIALMENDQVSNGAQASAAKQVIKRALKKRKRASGARGEMDDFLVGDTEEEEAWFDQFRQSDEASVSNIIEVGGQDGGDYNFASAAHVSNLIILTGPSGVGKTAAVYASAEELGFEVFEVYAGMGKRSGHSIMSLVGDLCLNHMVTSGGTGGGAFKGEGSNMQRLNFAAQKDRTSKSSVPAPVGAGIASRPRQSLILFEEVDVLYEEDKGFWPAMVELAAQSRRPIVLTCNDLGAIPLADLPVQRVLHFKAAALQDAVRYIQLVADEHGVTVGSATAGLLYDDKPRLSEHVHHDEDLRVQPHSTLHANTVLGYSLEDRCDLRQSLMQLQFLCALPNQVKTLYQDTVQDAELKCSLLKPIQAAECRSAGDVISTRSHARSAEALEPDQYGSSSDDVQLPATALRKNTPNGNEIALADYGREGEFADALMLPQCGTDQELGSRISYHQRRLQISKAIDGLCDELEMPLQLRPPSVAEATWDYMGVIHKMVKFDDAEESAHKFHVAQLLDEARKVQQASVTESNGIGGSTMATAAASLARIGIRPSRQSSRLLLQRDENGILQLGRKEADFFRYISLADDLLAEARQLAPAVDW
jgi:hypothetical protein